MRESNALNNDRAYLAEQAQRMERMFRQVVMAAIDDAVREKEVGRDGATEITRWANSRDGREVLVCAGIEPSLRTSRGLAEIVERGIRSSNAFAINNTEF